eukprot:CAMPEP_0170599906 /NCGR_PEP_ID=MMETSP0224-20130122/17052_1 /TAXON_ID=285029 /ORGANISM="Togula jolla, Strain CCCM 725" /LENGTH=356 /DNA_ID=CAMNT_0010924599 /DNA_START=34 /DNA_END=1104 /DNA_ORIENTATION=+
MTLAAAPPLQAPCGPRLAAVGSSSAVEPHVAARAVHGTGWRSAAGRGASDFLSLGWFCAAGLASAASSRGSRRALQSGRGLSLRKGTSATARAAGAGAPVVLDVRNVQAKSTDEAQKQILKGLNLTIREGEVHAVMGPNGSGKSTLSKVLIGDSSYEVTEGTAELAGQNLFDMEPHSRAQAGLFLAFQSPPTINGVSNLDFLRATYNAQRRERGEPEMDVIEFYGLATEKLTQLKINPDFLNRSVNEGFSGGERKRNEMLQMTILEPKLAILDEIDSGLDIDALKDVADAIAQVRTMDKKRSLLVVTHFERFLNYVDADQVHVMHQGRIIKSGGKELSAKLDEQGYDWVIKEAAGA